MSTRFRSFRVVCAAAAAALAFTACSSGDSSGTSEGSGECTLAETPVISFVAYSTPREVYGKIIPAFVSQWKADHDDQNVIFQESYSGSTTQAQKRDQRVRGRRGRVVARPRR